MNTELFQFETKKGYVRSGKLKTRAGTIKTPVFMPVGTRGAVRGLTPKRVAGAGSQIILGNTYHLFLQPGPDIISSLGGLHNFMNWQGPILTDSGGFQVFSLSHARQITEDGVTFTDPATGNKVFLSPEIAIRIQLQLGSDIIMAFDDVTGLDEASIGRTKEAVERTHRWLDRNIAEFKKLTKNMPVKDRPLLFGIVQGGLDKRLRKHSLKYVQSTDVDGIAIGGLSVGESRQDMHEMLDFLAPLYDPSRPRYLMGVGDPIDWRYAIERGIDMADCVLATRNARHGTAWIHNPCTCGKKSGKAGLSAASRTSSDSFSLRGPVTVPDVPLPRTSQKNFEISLECKTCGPIDAKIHLTNAKYAADAGSLDENCDCYTCKSGFSRGFLRHQFKVKESLAGSLVSIHNVRYLHRISEDYRNKD